MNWVKQVKKSAIAGMYHPWKTSEVIDGTYKGSDDKVVHVESNGRNYKIRATKTVREQLANVSVGDRIRIEYLGTAGNPPRRDFDVFKGTEDVA